MIVHELSTTSDASGSASAGTVNAFTVDVEDWVQSALDPDLPITHGFVHNTHLVLDLLAEHEVRATFFVLGLAAEKAPKLVRDIQAAGHEIQSHGFGHRLIHTQLREQFRVDVERSKKVLEDLTGEAITGFRAPAFSVTRTTSWALDVLGECGFEYDSSIVPARTRRYGIAGTPWFPYRLRTPAGYTLTEWPVATHRLFGARRPIGGGGYFRLYPLRTIRAAIGRINEAGRPATIYVHPYELNPDELGALPVAIPWRMRLHQGLGRRGLRGKLEGLLRTCSFGAIRDVARGLEEGSGAFN